MTTPSATIAIIDNGGWRSSYGRSLLGALVYDIGNERHFTMQPGGYVHVRQTSNGIESARNDAVTSFLTGTAEWLVMIDADMGFEPDAIARLLATAERSEAAVAGALCFVLDSENRPESPLQSRRWGIKPTVYATVEVPAMPDQGRPFPERGFLAILDYERDAVVDAATGTGFIVIRRDVLERIGARWFDRITMKGGNFDGTDRTFGEDLSFCLRVMGLGERVVVDTSIKTSHDKGGIFLDEETYDRERGRDVADQDNQRDV